MSYQHTKIITQNTRGATLVVALIFLILLTLIGVGTLQNTGMFSKVSATLQDRRIAQQSAGSALREGEAMVEALNNVNSFDNTHGLYTQGSAPSALASSTWTGTASIVSSQATTGITPRYFVEYLGVLAAGDSSIMVLNYTNNAPSSGSLLAFRVVARSVGKGNAEVVLQSYYIAQF